MPEDQNLQRSKNAKSPLALEPALTSQQRKLFEQQQLHQAQELLEEERVYRRGVVSVKDIIAPESIEVQNSYLRLGDLYLKTLFVIEYPRYINVGWFAQVINMDIMADIAFYFYPVPSQVILRQLKKKVGVLEAGLIGDAEKGAPRDPLRETALRDMEKLRDDLTQGIEHFFQYGMYVTAYGKSLEELDKEVERVENEIGSHLVFSRRGFYQSEQGFISTLPLALDELEVLTNINTMPVASAFPFVSSSLTQDSGIWYGINRHNTSLILFDPFSAS